MLPGATTNSHAILMSDPAHGSHRRTACVDAFEQYENLRIYIVDNGLTVA